MATSHGKDAYFSVDTKNLTTFTTDISVSRDVEVAESTTMGAEAKTYMSGLSDAKISISGKWDNTATTGADAVLVGLTGGDTAVAFEFGPEGNGSGKVKHSGSCFLTSYEVTAPIGDVVAFSAEFQVTGAVATGTFT